jgi:hypothetical protein
MRIFGSLALTSPAAPLLATAASAQVRPYPAAFEPAAFQTETVATLGTGYVDAALHH